MKSDEIYFIFRHNLLNLKPIFQTPIITMTQEQKIFPYIDRLLQGAEVVWKPLGEVAEVSAGNSAPQDNDLFMNGVYPFCRTSDVGKVHHSINFHQIQDKLNEEGIKGLRLYKKETILLPKSGASTLLNHRVMLTIDSYVSSHLATIYRKEEVVLAKFLFYFLSKFDIAELVPDKSYPSLKVSEIAKIQIPLPPLSVQQEIVRILDKFTQLEAELEAELDFRKRQYEYYRNKLLTFNEIGGGTEIVWKTLGEVLDIYTGGEAPKNLIRGERPQGSFIYPIYSNGEEIYGFTDNYRINKDAVTISSIGAKTGTIYFRKAYFTPIIRLKVLVPKNERTLNSRYVFHYLSNITISTKRSSVPNINANEVKSIKIPLPPLEEQERIANILDKFDTLVNSISEGLPKEIALRRKQYEYYRERLLTFRNDK